jgi:hypothetical protein
VPRRTNIGRAGDVDLRTNFDLYSGYYGFGALRGVVGAYLRRFHNSTDLTLFQRSAARPITGSSASMR